MGRLEKKISIVTGASKGIGLAIVQRFAIEGASVLAVSRGRDVEALAAPNIEPWVCDVSDPEAVRLLFDHCRKKYGRLDVLVNNAGIGGISARTHEYPLEEWDKVVAVNMRGNFIVLKEALALMLDSGGGSVINMGSVGGIRATPGVIAYLSSKGAMMMMTRTAALEYALDNIRVNVVCPSATATPILTGQPEERIAKLAARHAQNRLGTPEEVASLTLFLASDEASHITGGSYIIDGGRCAGG